jgi:hypothetical protein
VNAAAMLRRAGWLPGAALALVVLTACTQADAVIIPSSTPSPAVPSPVPPTSTDADGRALPGFVTLNTQLPAAQPAPADVLSATGPGWSLQTYRPQVAPRTGFGGGTPGVPASVQVLYLVSPQGKRYQLLELDPAKPILVDSWSAGESVAYVTQCDPLECDPTAPTQVLDLLTGSLSEVAFVDKDMRIGATIAGSHRWWHGASGSALETAKQAVYSRHTWLAASASPDGTLLALWQGDSISVPVTGGMAVVDVATGRSTDIAQLWTEPLDCAPFRWRADNALDVSCFDPLSQLWRVFTVGPHAQEMKENKAATATPPADGPWVQPNFFASTGVWAGPYTTTAAERLAPTSAEIGLARNGSFEPLTVPDAAAGTVRIVASVAGSLYVEASQANNPSLTTAWGFDVASSTWTELGALPPNGPTRGPLAAQGSPAQGLTSWSVAP